MRTLTDQIAHDHEPMTVRGVYQCSCGEKCPFRYFDKYRDLSEWHRAHTNAVTEAAVRERVAQDIEATYLGPDFGRNPITGQDSPYAMHAEAYDEGLADAARIARGSAGGE